MKNDARTTVRNFIAETFEETYSLTVTQNCHITNNTFNTSGGKPKATRINFLDYLYCGSPLSAGQGKPGSAMASKEVIIPGGAFKSQLSATPLELYSTYRINTRFPSMRNTVLTSVS
jgi:choline dehydrogenase